MYAICNCLENLVTHAIKYSDRDGNLYISPVHRLTGNRPGEVWISVARYGNPNRPCGIGEHL